MQIIVMAHRGEAQTFFKQKAWKNISMPFDGLYQSEDEMLLICGEGSRIAGEKLAATLGRFPAITNVINLGVAGALNDNVEVDHIYSVRTIYAENNGKMEFKSFTAISNGKDLVTASARVLDIEYANQLENFAPLVDREAWGLASVCALLKLDFAAYKLVSDRIGSTSEICQVVKERAPEFSDRLFDFYESLHPEQSKNVTAEAIDLAGLYFTLSMQRQYQTLKNTLSRKGFNESDIFTHVNLQEIQQMELRPKERASVLLQRMSEMVNPLNSIISRQLDELLEKFEHGQFKVTYDKELEKPFLNLHARLEHPKHINDLITALEDFDLEKFQNLIENGPENV